MRIQRSKTSKRSDANDAVRSIRRWSFRGVVVGAVALGLTAGLVACAETSGDDPLPLGDSDPGVIVEDTPADDQVEEGEMQEGG